MYCDRRLANYERWSAEPPEDARMIVSPVVKKSVVFLGWPGEDPAATGFIVSLLTAPGRSVSRRTHYLVTAAHCIPTDGSPLEMRVNLRDGSVRPMDAPLTWWRHPTDTAVDVAVARWPESHEANIAMVPEEMFARDGDFYADDDPPGIAGRLIGEGDEVFITGLFADAHGERRNLPVVRTGNIARLTDYQERILTEWPDGPIIAHLIEARSRGGLSGSPVFARRSVEFTMPNEQNPSHGPLKFIAYGADVRFLGLIHGHADDARRPSEAINMGIAFVVPAKHVLETLAHPELEAMREQEFRRSIGRMDGDE